MQGSNGKGGTALATAERATVSVMHFAIVIISHGALAVELKRALEHLMGPQPLVAALAIPADESLEHTRRRLHQVIDSLPPLLVDGSEHGDNGRDDRNDHAGILQRPLVFLSDLFGGTPANLALAEVRRRRGAALITGANLPVLVRLAELRGQVDPHAAVEEAAAAGRRFIRTEHGGGSR